MPDALDRNVETLKSKGFVEFLRTGQPAAGEFHCSGCGYGVIVQLELPRCPMCSGTAWEQAGWGAFGRRTTELLQ
jgi:rubrerythrin